MRRTVQQLLLYLLFPIAAGVVIYYFTTRAVPDVRYSLSEKIPVTFADPTNTTLETVQQLEVKNIGNAEGNKIVVKINGQVTAYTINKYSGTDSIQVFEQQQPIEFVYSQLPPQAGFKIVFKTASNGVDYNDVTVSHNTGLAREALSGQSTSSSILSIGLVIFYATLSAITLRSSFADIRKSGLRHQGISKIIQGSKPWYVSDSEWSLARLEAAKEILSKNDIWYDIAKDSTYQFLTMDKLDHIPNKDWKEMTDRAIDELEKNVVTP